jgi:hypothetical protein
MARHRTRVRISRSLRSGAVVLLAALTTTALFEADLGRGLLLSSAMVAGAPPVLYLLLAFALLRGAPFSRRLGWAVGACGIYAALGLFSGVTLSFAHPMSMEGALRRCLWSYAPAPFISLLAAPLVLLAWRSRLVSARVVVRAARAQAPLVARVPGPPLPSATPDWDSVLQVSTPPQWASAQATAVFERAGRERDGVTEEPVREERKPAPPVVAAPPAATAAPPAATAGPMVAAPAPAVTAKPLVAAPAPVAPPPAPKAAAPAPKAAPAAPKAASPAPRAPAPVRVAPPASSEPTTPASEAVVRVPFDRIADQLPPDVFTLPPARLGESLHEAHVILVPCRLILPQLGEGAVEIPWTLVDGQFPDLAFAMPQAEVRRRFPGWVISLPMDEVVRQIPLDTFRVQGPAADLSDIGEFPAPFTPGPPEPEEPAAPPTPEPVVKAERAPVAKAQPAPVVPPPAPVPVVAAEPLVVIPEVLFAPEPSPAPVVAATPVAPPAPVAPSAPSAPMVPPARVAPPHPAAPATPTPPAAPASRAPTATPVAPRPAPVTPAVAPTPQPAARVEPKPAEPAPTAAVADEEAEALGRALAPSLTPLGAFDWQAWRVEGRPVASFVPRALPREAIDRLVVCAAPLVERLASWGIEQMTIRTARLAFVLTPLGARGCLAAAVRRGGTVAMLEVLSTRATRAAGARARAAAAIAFPSVATTPARAGNGAGDVGGAARALAAFGPLAASVAEAEGAAPSVYVFAGQDQAVLAGAARAVHEGLIARHDAEALGRLDSVVLRRGRERFVLRPLLRSAGAPAVLAAAGAVALAGRAHRAAAQAATLLEAR